MLNNTIKIGALFLVFCFASCGEKKSSKDTSTSSDDSINLEFWETYDNMEALSLLNEADIALSEHLYPGERKRITEKRDKEYEEKMNGTIDTVPLLEDTLSQDELEDELLTSEPEPETISEEPTKDEFEDQAKFSPLFSVLMMPVQQGHAGRMQIMEGAMVGYAKEEDTAQINSYLSHDATFAVWPNDLVFRWSFNTTDEIGDMPVYTLYALKRNEETDGAAMIVDHVRNVFVSGKEAGNPSVDFRLSDKVADSWETFTSHNIRKHVAMVFNEEIYFAPKVMSTIYEGKVSISGAFSKEEVEEIVRLLKGKK
jgi:hypothetical protein